MLLKAYFLRKILEFFSGKNKSGEKTNSKKNDQTEMARGLGRKIREEIGKEKQTTAVRLLID